MKPTGLIAHKRPFEVMKHEAKQTKIPESLRGWIGGAGSRKGIAKDRRG
jgi:hypothetical protein